MSEEQKKLVKIRISRAETGDIDNTLRLNGEVQLNLDETAKIMPSLPGFVTKNPCQRGRHGQERATPRGSDQPQTRRVHSNYNSALEQEKLTHSEYRMAEKLIGKNATSQKDYLRYKREYAEAVIARQRAEELLRSLLVDPAHNDHVHQNLEKTAICTDYEVRAPIDGTVISKDITLGENFPEDNSTVVFTISNLKHLWLDLQANNTELQILKTGRKSRFRLRTPIRNIRDGLFTSPRSSMKIHGSGWSGLLQTIRTAPCGPGQFVTGVIQAAGSPKSVFVPREAIQLLDGETVVFVPQGDGFAPKPVATGETAKGLTQILSGLHAGDSYVSGGAFELKSILLTSGMDPHAGHGH
ncbi:MAG: efflux RND transporter periplasmic adaptor subunit [Victivallales bacterium]